jgi:hypothetical protein
VTDEFQHEMPVNGLILVAAIISFLKLFLCTSLLNGQQMKGVLSGFHNSGTDKVPDLTADTCRLNFNLL